MKYLIKPFSFLLGVAVLLSAPPALAQQTGAIEEIVVTAQFREERLQDTPIAISAISDEMLRARSVNEIYQTTQFAPNVQLRPAPGPFGSSMNAFIRGVGQDDFEFAREPGVGMYIDDIYFPTLTGSNFGVLDLQRVEILRGPQGTTQGRNSIGGAVRMITKKPTGEGGGYVELTFGRFDRIGGKAAGEFTILPDQLFLRVSGMYDTKDGFQDRIDFACARPADAAAMGIPSSGNGLSAADTGCKIGTLGGKSVGSGRAELRWLPTDRLEVRIIGDLTQDTSEPPAQTLRGVSAGATANYLAATGQVFDNRFRAPDIHTTYETFGNFDASQNPPLLPPAGGSSTSLTGPWSPPIENKIQTWGIAGIINYQFNDRMDGKLIVSHRELDNEFATTSDGSPLALETGFNHPFGESLQVEGRLNTALFDNRLDTTLGVFYFDQDNRNIARINIPYASPPSGVPGFGSLFIFDFTTDQFYHSESLGIYGHAVFHATDRLNLTAGIRYSDEEKVQDLFRLDPATGGTSGSTIVPFAAVDPVTGLAGSNTFATERVDWRASVDYRWTEQLMTYFTFSTGFKSGGVSPRFFFLSHIVPYDEEEVQAFEVGFKSDLLDNRLRVNAAGFFNMYDDQQIGANECPDLVPSSPCLADRNLANSNIWGAELEANFVPTPNLRIDASASWIQMEFTELAPVNIIGPTFRRDADVPEQTPEWKFSVGAQYDFSLGPYGTLTPRVDVTYEDEKRGFDRTGAVGFDSTKALPVDSHTLVNARLTWRSIDEDWEMAFALTNATDEEYFFNQFDISAVGAWASARPAPPREWSLTIRRNFN